MMYQANPSQGRMMYPPAANNQAQYNLNYNNYNNAYHHQNMNNNMENQNINKKENFTIDKVREFPLKMIVIEREYDVIKEIGSGDYGKVILATHKRTNTQVALKAVPKLTTPIKDFFFEFHYSYFLSPHHIILDTYDVAFETRDFYYFAQEVAPLGDLWQAVERTEGAGLLERDAKVIIQQLTEALEFMHEKQLVHRDFRPENVLVFAPDFSKVKLTDFGLTRKAGTLVKKRTRSLPTCPPEIWYTIQLEGYHVELGSDVWQMAMFIFIITQSRFCWEKADITDVRFNEFCEWQKRKTTKIPREFTRFTPRIMRLFRRLMELKPSKRYPIKEVKKYLGDQWLKPRVARTQTMYVQNRPTQSLDLPQHSVKRESLGGAAMNQNFNMHQPVSRSLSCSQLFYNQNNNNPYGQQPNNNLPQVEQPYAPNRNPYLLPS